MSTQYTSRSAIAALTAAQSEAIGDATVKSTEASERWLYSTSASDAAQDDMVIVPSDAPTIGRWLRQTDYAALIAILSAIGTGTWSGTVTSVGLSLPSDLFAVSAPVTGDGTLTATLKSQVKNMIWASPGSGDDAPPSFRELVVTDIPDLSADYDTAGAAAEALNAANAYTDDKTPAAGNPTATAGATAVNGTAETFMRSDAAPAVQLATTAQAGLIKPDGTTVTIDSDGTVHAVTDPAPVTKLAFVLELWGR